MLSMKKSFSASIFVISQVLLVTCMLPAQNSGDWLVKLSGKSTPQELFHEAGIIESLSDWHFSPVSQSLNIWRVSTQSEAYHGEIWLRSLPGVLVFQQNYELRQRGLIVPDDPLFQSQWPLLNPGSPDNDTDAPEAWNYTTGGLTPAGDTVVVAVIDAGFNALHPDLEPNHWKNSAEVPGDGLDNDANGYTDDYRGWNVVSQNDDITGTATLHGNGVAGIIGAAGNNSKGITGVNWRVKMMLVAGGNTIAGIIAACDYIRMNRKLYNETGGQKGAFVVAVNTSWGLDYGFPSDAPLWCEMLDLMGEEGILTVAATANNPVDIDLAGDLPATCPSTSLVSVTSLGGTGLLAATSSWGMNTVDLATFGEGVLSLSSQSYAVQSGTSFAAPHVAGAVGLLYSGKCPELAILNDTDPFLAAQKVKELICSTVDSSAALLNKTVSAGKLNLGNLLSTYEKGCPDCPQPFVLKASANIFQAVVSWHSSSAATGFQVRWRITNGNWMFTDSVSASALTLSGLQSCTEYEFQVKAFCSLSGWSDWSQSAFFLTEGCCSAPNWQITSVEQSSSVSLSWLPPEYYTLYRILYKKSDSPNSWMVVVTDNPMVVIDGLSSCTTYDVKIFGFCLDGWNLLADNFQFVTRGCGACYDATFCTAAAQDAQQEWIASVKLGNWEHTSGQGGAGYQDFSGKTDSIPVIMPLSSVSLAITPGFWGGGYKEYYRVFIDYNFNGVFEIPAELAFDSGFSLQGTLTGNIQTPFFTTAGITRMRVLMKYTEVDPTPPGPCSSFEFGQVEDYCVELRTSLTGTVLPAAPDNQLLVYPVPATDFADISLEKPEELNLRIYASDGRLVTTAHAVSGHITLTVSHWAPGIYHLQARAGERVWRRALLKI